MKKTFRALSSVICIISILITSFHAYAQTQISDKALFDLKSFGILSGDENGEYHFENQITRAEFAKMISYALNMEDWVSSGQSFSDVSQDAWYYNYVMHLHDSRLIDGYPDGTFRPEEYVSYHEAVKILVCALGYQVTAQDSGGYPDGYVQTAIRIGLLDGVQLENSTFTRKDAARMFYNALDIDRMTLKTGGFYGETEIISGNTLRNLHLKEVNDEQMLKGTGIITANVQTWLTREIGEIENDEVEINGILYKAGGTQAVSLIGQEVDYYAVDGPDGLILQSVMPTRYNETLLLDEESFYEFKNGRLYYYEDDENSKEKSFGISNEVQIVKNFVPLTEFVIEDITLESGTMKVIDNNGDSKADVIFIEEYKSLVVDSVKGPRVYFVNGQTIEGRNFLELDDENDDMKFVLKDAQGQALAVEDIEAGDVISVCVSENRKRVQCVINREIVSGSFTAVRLNSTNKVIKIDDKEYELSARDVYDEAAHKLNSVIDAYIDFRGKVAYIKVVDKANQYAYILNVIEDADTGGTLVKLLIPGQMKVLEEEVESSDENDDSTVPILKVGNSAYQTVPVADSVNIDGTKYKDHDKIAPLLSGQVVRYSMNAKNEIARIEYPVKIGDNALYKKYNAYEQVFGGYGNGVFGIDEKLSVGICVPSNEVNGNEDYLATVRLDDAARYTVSGYDIDNETKNANLIVITETLDIDASNAINDYSPIAVMQEISRGVNADGDEVWFVKFWSEGKEQEFAVPTDSAASDMLGQMQTGTVFYYALSVNDEISRIQIVENLKDLSVTYDEGSSSTERMVYGDISDIEVNTLSDINYRRIDKMFLSVEGNDGTVSIELNRRNTPDLYSYNPVTGVVKAITLEELSPSWSSKYSNQAFVHIKYNKVKGVVMIEK